MKNFEAVVEWYAMESNELINPTDAPTPDPPQAAPREVAEPVATFGGLVVAALTQRKVKPRCPECGLVGFDRFHLNDAPVLTPTVAQGQVLLSAAFVCKRCGATKLYNLNVLGIHVRQEERRIVTPQQAQAGASPLIVPG